MSARHMAFFLAFAALYLASVLIGLHPEPHVAPDSRGYLEFADHRPHGYSAFLAIHQMLFGGLRYLPQAHAALFVGSVVALAMVVGIVVRSALAALLLFVVGAALAPGREFYGVMAEPLYAALLNLAVAAFLLYVRSQRAALLGATSLLLAMAATTRTIGYAPLLAFGACVALALWHARGVRWRAALAATLLPAALVLLAAAASTYHHNGAFRIGSWAGMSLLGKGLVVARPLPPGQPLSALNWVAEATSPAREALSRTDNVVLRMLLARQYYEYLRWFLIWPLLDERWPPWAEPSEYRRGRAAGELAAAYIGNDPRAYAELVALDWASLWLVPRLLTETERAALAARIESMGELAFLDAFAQTPAGQNQYYRVLPEATAAATVWVVRFVSLGFLLMTILTLPRLFLRRRGRKTLVGRLDMLFVILIVHGTYAATALTEAGLERYVFPTWPILTAGFVMMLHDLMPAGDRAPGAMSDA